MLFTVGRKGVAPRYIEEQEVESFMKTMGVEPFQIPPTVLLPRQVVFEIPGFPCDATLPKLFTGEKLDLLTIADQIDGLCETLYRSRNAREMRVPILKKIYALAAQVEESGLPPHTIPHSLIELVESLDTSEPEAGDSTFVSRLLDLYSLYLPLIGEAAESVAGRIVQDKEYSGYYFYLNGLDQVGSERVYTILSERGLRNSADSDVRRDCTSILYSLEVFRFRSLPNFFDQASDSNSEVCYEGLVGLGYHIDQKQVSDALIDMLRDDNGLNKHHRPLIARLLAAAPDVRDEITPKVLSLALATRPASHDFAEYCQALNSLGSAIVPHVAAWLSELSLGSGEHIASKIQILRACARHLPEFIDPLLGCIDRSTDITFCVNAIMALVGFAKEHPGFARPIQAKVSQVIAPGESRILVAAALFMHQIGCQDYDLEFDRLAEGYPSLKAYLASHKYQLERRSNVST